MPERSFGRTVRYRRTKLGLSQAQLGELVGRSPSTIRSWERDKSAPTEDGVLHALAAILGVDERSLFEKAGQELSENYETSPTVEQALATLRPEEPTGTAADSEREAAEVDAEPSQPELFEPPPPEPPRPERAREPASVAVSGQRPGYVKPPASYVVTPTTPPFVEPSYMEDSNQRQLYRVRNLATLVVAVALVIAFIWALSESLGALGDWWDDFFGSLRL